LKSFLLLIKKLITFEKTKREKWERREKDRKLKSIKKKSRKIF